MDAHGEIGDHPRLSAQERFKARSRYRFWYSLAIAVAIHLLILFFWRAPLPDGDPTTEMRESNMRELRLVELEEVGRPELRRPAAPRAAGPAPPAIPAAPAPPDLALVETEATRIVEESFEALYIPTTPPLEVPPPPEPEEVVPTGLERFRPVTALMQKPELVNRSEVKRVLRREYPRALQRRGVEGSVVVLFWIDEEGEVEKYELRVSSGNEELDAAAERVIPKMKFRPAIEKGEAVAVVVSLPITFRVE